MPKDKQVKKVREVVSSNRDLTMREVPDEAGISKTSYRKILTENLGMQHFAVRSVPCLLTEEQKQGALL